MKYRLFSLFSLLFVASFAHAQTLFQHSGNGNPALNGWIQTGPLTSGVTAGPVSNDLGLGINAWNIRDSSQFDGSYLQYSKNMTNSEVNAASTSGWLLSTRLRVVDIADTVDFSIFSEYYSGTRAYSMLFGSSVAGDPIIRLLTGGNGDAQQGPLFVLSGLGSGYHTYILQANGGSSAASFFVDGIEIFTGFTGRSLNLSPHFAWGTGQSSSTGAVNFADVSFSVGTTAPEPGALYLLVVGGSLATLIRRRFLP